LVYYVRVKQHQVTSYNRININTAHLIPAAALWQGPKFITVLFNSALKGSFLLFIVWSVSVVMSATPVFNIRARERQNQYQLCMAQFKLQGSYTTKDFTDTSTRCWAHATVRSFQKETR
jgi:hypothetical protein